NAAPAAVSATTRIAGRSASVATAALRSRAKRASPALSTSGRSSVRRASAPAISSRIVASEVIGQWFTIRGLVTPLLALLCLGIFATTFSTGAFPAILPELARGGALADWQVGLVAGAFGFARMAADIPIGLFLTHHLRRAVVVGPCVLAVGVLVLTSGGTFPVLVLGRLLMGVGHAPGPRPLFARQAAAGPDAPGAPITPALVLAFVAGGAIAVAYSTVEQFSIPLRGSRELGLERAGVARLLVVMQVFDIAALLPLGVLADRRGTVPALVAVLLAMAAASALVGFGTLPVVAAGCALYGLGMAGWMLPLGVLR